MNTHWSLSDIIFESLKMNKKNNLKKDCNGRLKCTEQTVEIVENCFFRSILWMMWMWNLCFILESHSHAFIFSLHFMKKNHLFDPKK